MKPEFEPSGSTALCLSPGFVALGEFSFPGWDAGLWQGYPLPTSNFYTWARRETLESKMCRLRIQLSETGQDSKLLRPLDRVSSALIQTTRSDSSRISCDNRPLGS